MVLGKNLHCLAVVKQTFLKRSNVQNYFAEVYSSGCFAHIVHLDLPQVQYLYEQ